MPVRFSAKVKAKATDSCRSNRGAVDGARMFCNILESRNVEESLPKAILAHAIKALRVGDPDASLLSQRDLLTLSFGRDLGVG